MYTKSKAMASEKILEGYSNLEKGAYLGAIASISTADRSATEDEIDHIEALCDSAGLSEDQKELILSAAQNEMPESELRRCLDVLKTSELRFSLISDVIAFAQADKNYSEEEKHAVQQMADYLGVNQEQFSVLDQFTKKAIDSAPSESESTDSTPSGFFDKLGFGDKFKNAGINSGSFLKGALGILGPIFLAKMLTGRRGRGMGGGGLLSGLLGGGLLGNLLGGGGSRGFGGAGGLLGKIFGRSGV